MARWRSWHRVSLAAKKSARKKPPLLPVLLGLLAWLMGVFVLDWVGRHPFAMLVVGQRAPATMVARVDFYCDDLARTELNRQQAVAAVPPVFRVDPLPLSHALRTVDKLVHHVRRARQEAPSEEELAIANVLDLLGLPVSPSGVLALFPPEREAEFGEALKSALRAVWYRGLASPEVRKAGYAGLTASGVVALMLPDGSEKTIKPAEDLLGLDEAVAEIAQRMDGLTEAAREGLGELLRVWLVPNLLYDQQTTDERRRQAAASVPAATMKVQAGSILVEAGEVVTPQILEMLHKHAQRYRQLESVHDYLIKQIGGAAFLLAAVAASACAIYWFMPPQQVTLRYIVLLLALSAAGLLPIRPLLDALRGVMARGSVSADFVLPLAFPSLMASILAGPMPALILGLWNGIVASIALEYRLSVLLLCWLVTTVCILAARRISRRADIFRTGVLIGCTQVFVFLAWAAVHGLSPVRWPIPAAATFATGLGCALLTGMVLPLFETLFGITTDLTLMELSDLRHPLLQRLATEAPGTYHHSIAVANLAESAARRIGANQLLVRAAAYFHDIGKLAKPEFFIENMRGGENPHDQLPPQMSSLVITSHVREGLELARLYRLPRVIVDGIEQHHGTGLVSYFYRRAQQQEGAEGDASAVDPTVYRYAGERPRTREAGILALADAVEAALRTLEKPTPARIQALVDEIVDARYREGQLDECPLTLAELAAIKRSFVFDLASMFHVRIAYPPDENRPSEPSETSTGSSGAASSARETPR